MKSLERTILAVLNDVHPHMMPDRQLFGEVNLAHAVATTRADFDARLVALQHHEGGAQIVGIAGDDTTRWKITPEGRARLLVG